jgi:hypothetical protein
VIILLEKLKELNKKSPLQLEAWEIDSLMQISLEQAEKIERYEKGFEFASRRLVSMCGMSDNPKRPTLDDALEIYTILRKTVG